MCTLNALHRQSIVLHVLAKRKCSMPSWELIWTTVLWCGSIETKLTLLNLKRYRKGQSVWSSMIKCQPIVIYSGGHGFPSSDQMAASKIIIQPKCNTTHGLNSLTYQGAKLWNRLLEHIKAAESVNKFQILIEKHIV